MSSFESPLAADLRGALRREEMAVEYQPQIELATDRIVAVEALCRWNHPTLGPIPPSTFITLAEDHDLIDEIGDFVVEQGCRNAAEWAELGLRVEMSINVSALQLDGDRFFVHFLAHLAHCEVEPTLMTIEITESQAISDVPRVVVALDGLRQRGIGVSIDDYGTGHTSVKQLLSLPATELKIDQSLVQRVGEATDTLLTSLVQFAHDRGLRVVAEGVETNDQLERVRQFGCDRAQGYLIGRSMSESAIQALLLEVDQE